MGKQGVKSYFDEIDLNTPQNGYPRRLEYACEGWSKKLWGGGGPPHMGFNRMLRPRGGGWEKKTPPCSHEILDRI